MFIIFSKVTVLIVGKAWMGSHFGFKKDLFFWFVFTTHCLLLVYLPVKDYILWFASIKIYFCKDILIRRALLRSPVC